jgi:hypothetical protein
MRLVRQRDPAAPLTSTLTAPLIFMQLSVPATFTKPGPNAAQELPAAPYHWRKPVRRCGEVQFRTAGRISQNR